jgi:hypothetical protein
MTLDFTDDETLALAHLLIRRHGPDAEPEAARFQDLMLDRGDDEGRRIRWAIEQVQEPPDRRPN